MTTPTTTGRKTAAKKAAPAKAIKAPAQATPTPAARKLRWQVEGDDRSQAGKVGQTASVDGHTYAITGKDKAWKATVKVGGRTTVLAEGSFAAAYRACVEHNRAR